MPKVDVYLLFDVGVFAYLDVRCSMFDVHLFLRALEWYPGLSEQCHRLLMPLPLPHR